MRHIRTALAVTAILSLSSGCYSTKVHRPGMASGDREYQKTQVFTAGGLVPVSPASGGECASGFERVESSVEGRDIALAAGLSVASILISAFACDGQPGCTVAAGSLIPLIVATRTVKYTCLSDEAALSPSEEMLAPPEAEDATPNMPERPVTPESGAD